MINKVIYYCWFGGEKPQKVIDCIKNWKEKLPDYEIIEINEYNKELFDVERECQNNLWFKTVWENKLWAYVADYARLKVLYERGGIYFDTDITVEKDITELLAKNKLVLGWEDEQSINVAVGVVNKENQLIKEMLNFYNEKIWHSNLYTIPQITTYVLRKHYKLNPSTEVTENEEVLIFPPEYFYPIPYYSLSRDKNEFVTDKTYTVHWWNESWCKDNINFFLKYKHKKNIQKLIEKCFSKKIIFENKFLKIEKLFEELKIDINYHYLFRFRHKIEGDKKYLTVFILGNQITIWRVK